MKRYDGLDLFCMFAAGSGFGPVLSAINDGAFGSAFLIGALVTAIALSCFVGNKDG